MENYILAAEKMSPYCTAKGLNMESCLGLLRKEWQLLTLTEIQQALTCPGSQRTALFEHHFKVRANLNSMIPQKQQLSLMV